VLSCEHARKGTARHGSAPDENLPELTAHPLLLGQRALKLGLGEQALVDEERTERAPGEIGLVHVALIGRSGLAE
jgi:hypothetical protein